MPGFYDTAHLHIGFNVSSLTEIQYLEHMSNEHISMKP